MKALVVGGTGPTGPSIVRGLIARGYEVTIYHRGFHELADLPPLHGHQHGDPDDLERLRQDLGATRWDLAIAMYGRLRHVASVMAGRCDRFIGISGMAGYVPPDQLPFPAGRRVPWTESHPRHGARSNANAIGWAVAETERGVLAHHAAGDFSATVFRYANLYGPRVPRQWLWPLVRRVLDGRPHVVLPGDGGTIQPICYAENAAHQVLLAVDRPEAAGQVFHSVDRQTFALRDIVRLVADELGHEWEAVAIEHPLASALATGYAGPDRWLDTSRLAYVLGYSDAVAPEAGLRATVRWLAEHRAELHEDQLAALVPNPYAYELEDRLIESFLRWQADVAATMRAPERRAAAGPGFRGTYRPPTP